MRHQISSLAWQSKKKNKTNFTLKIMLRAFFVLLLLVPSSIRADRSAFSMRGDRTAFVGFSGREGDRGSDSVGIRTAALSLLSASLSSSSAGATRKPSPVLLRRHKSAASLSTLEAHRFFNDGNIVNESNSDSSSSSDEIPLVFLHGMKGSHLAFSTGTNGQERTQRSWLSLGGLLNFPSKEDDNPERDISLPLSYSDDDSFDIPVQDRSKHFVDGTVDHVVELSGLLPGIGGPDSDTGNLDFFPFYGHATKFLEEINDAYIQDNIINGGNSYKSSKGADADRATTAASSSTVMRPRPTRSFCYDWRRNLFELAEEFHDFCEREFPNGQPVQVVAHSLGGLIAYAAMKEHPNKYEPGGVLVGVPFGTGIQYFQDMHKGYFTELGTCRQFLPPAQFTFSSHWSFFPMDRDEIADSFVDVSEYYDDDGDNNGPQTIAFEADRSTIGKKTASSLEEKEDKWRPATPGKPIEINFYDPEEWEKNEIGIFDPSYRQMLEAIDKNLISDYKNHMKLQMKDAARWRNVVLAPWEDEDEAKRHMPPLTICSSISVPTPNQILRRKRQATTSGKSSAHENFPRSLISLFEMGQKNPTPSCQWEYDYASGRTVPGDGRIDYDKSFPPTGTSFQTIDIKSLHSKQFCWEEKGGDLSTVWEQVNQQLEDYYKTNNDFETTTANATESVLSLMAK